MVMMRGFRMDPSITKQKLKPGTIRRIAAYARPYRMHLTVFLLSALAHSEVNLNRSTPERDAVSPVPKRQRLSELL